MSLGMFVSFAFALMLITWSSPSPAEQLSSSHGTAGFAQQESSCVAAYTMPYGRCLYRRMPMRLAYHVLIAMHIAGFSVRAADPAGFAMWKASELKQHDTALSTHVADDLFFSSRRRHTRFDCDWSSDVCSSD